MADTLLPQLTLGELAQLSVHQRQQTIERTTVAVLLGLALVSFGVSQWSAHNWQSGGFFLIPSRMWELLLGAILVFCPEPKRWKVSWPMKQRLLLLQVIGLGERGRGLRE